MTRVIAVATVLLALMVLAPTAALAREESRRICARSATVRDTPRGFAIARLYRRDRVTVVRRSAARGWVPIRTRSGLPGWILKKSLCRG